MGPQNVLQATSISKFLLKFGCWAMYSSVGNEELYLTQTKQLFDPDPALRYNMAVCALDASGLPTSIALSTSQYKRH